MNPKNVSIINDHPMNKGLGRYAETIYNYFREDINLQIKLYSIAFGYNMQLSDFPGEVIYNPLDVKLRAMIPFIKNLPDFSHFIQSRFTTHLILKNKRYFYNGYIVDSVLHYTNPGIFPFKIDHRTIVTIHDLIFNHNHGLKYAFGDANNRRYLNLYRNCPFILTFTNYVKKELENIGFDAEVRKIFPAVSETFYPLHEVKSKLRERLCLPQDKVLLLSVSTNRPGKNLKVLREVMDLLDEKYKLVRVGTPVGNSFNFNKVSDKTLNELYNACDALVFPSIEEGVGLPVIEALAAGLPVVASDIEVMQEVCGNAAILTEPIASKIAESIKSLEANSVLLKEMGINRARLFRGERFVKEMRAFYEEVIST